MLSPITRTDVDTVHRTCPVPALKIQRCICTGNYEQIKNYLKEKHCDVCYDYGEEELRIVKGFHNVGFYYEFLFSFNKVFLQLFLREDDKYYVSVCYVGHTENAAKCKYNVKFVNEDNTEGV
jgi:hypothetical protein